MLTRKAAGRQSGPSRKSVGVCWVHLYGKNPVLGGVSEEPTRVPLK